MNRDALWSIQGKKRYLQAAIVGGIRHTGKILRGARAPQRFYKGGSAPAEILLNLIAVTILANPKTLDVAKKDNIYT